MPDETTILSLPLILPAQAQKHVTHNEALVALDLIVQLVVISRTLTTAPALPAEGDRYIVATGATGPWAGQVGRIALYDGAGWQFTEALPGWRAHVLAEGQTAVFDGLGWQTPSEVALTVPQLGVAATADATNRLTVSAPATLLNHAGSGHQLKLNKATAGDTASLLFQTGFSGRAEMGTAGDDDFAVKVSADGAVWFTALEAEAATGEVTLARPLHLGGQTSDPASPANGTLWLNTTTGEVKVRTGGLSLPLGGGGVSDGDRGDITVSSGGTVWTVDPGAITLGKLASMATANLLGRNTAGTGAPEVLSPALARGILNVANGATANASDAALRDRASHTGTQLAATIGDFTDASRLAPGYATTAASGGTTTLTAGSADVQVFTGTSTQTVVLPVASTLALGRVFRIKNESTGNVTVQSSGLNTVGSILNEGQDASYTCVLTSGTGAASWLSRLEGGRIRTGFGNLVFSNAATLGNPTFTGLPQFPAGSTTNPSLRLPHGVAPASPTDGDIWTTTTGVFARLNGATVDLAATGGGGATDLSYVAATRTLESSTGADVVLPLVSTTVAGLAERPESGPTRFYAFNDLHRANSDMDWLIEQSGTGASVSARTDLADGGFGWCNFNLGTVATNRCSILAGPAALRFGLGPVRYGARVRQLVLSDATNTFTQRVGFLDVVTGESVDGAFFRYTHSVNSGRWLAVTRSNNVETTVDTGITAAINTTSRFEVQVDAAGTVVEFRIDGALVATITTTIPTAAGRETGAGIMLLRSVGTTSITPVTADYVLVDQMLTAAR